LLRLVQPEHAREQQRPHLGDGRAHRVPLLAENIPEDDGHSLRPEIDAELPGAVGDLGIVAARLTQARKVALNVCHKDGNAGPAEALGQRLQSDRLPGSSRAGYQAMAVGHRWQE
jgi:hypothetical protein